MFNTKGICKIYSITNFHGGPEKRSKEKEKWPGSQMYLALIKKPDDYKLILNFGLSQQRKNRGQSVFYVGLVQWYRNHWKNNPNWAKKYNIFIIFSLRYLMT